MAVIHAKVSAVSDGGDSSLVQPTDWNAGHTINDIIPDADSTYKLGASGTAWTSVYTEGVSFPATQVPSADVNTLDDYQEGTWTPTGNVITFANASGTYTKVGRMVFATFSVEFPTTSDTGNAEINGLPFACAALSGSVILGWGQNATDHRAEVTGSDSQVAFFTLAGVAMTNANFSAKWVEGVAVYSV